MPSHVYTTRFVGLRVNAGQSPAYQVPAGKRAVVTNVVYQNMSGAAGDCILTVGPTRVFLQAMTASFYQEIVWSGKVVALAGESIVVSAPGCDVSVTGWLFNDP